MNKLLVAVFDTETAADAGLNALRTLHTAGDITLYASGVIVRDTHGTVSVRKSMASGAIGTVTGLAVGGLIGLLGGPVGMAIGAATGTVAGAVRDFWVAGVGVDFVEEVSEHLQPGKVALVAEVEEEWIIPADTALEAVGGHVFRRARTESIEAQFDHDIAAFKAELRALAAEASRANGAVKATLQAKIDTATTRLDGAMRRAQQRIDTLKQDADAKAEALKLQLGQSRDEARTRIEDRMKRVRNAHHARGAKLAHAWSLTKDALTA